MDTKVLITALVDLVLIALTKITELRRIAKQSGELTPEQEAALDQKLKDGFQQAHWQPSPPPPQA